MAHQTAGWFTRWVHEPTRLQTLRGLVAATPLVLLAAYWIGGESALIGVAIVLPAIRLLVPNCDSASTSARRGTSNGVLDIDSFVERVEIKCQTAGNALSNSAIFMVEIDDMDPLKTQYGPMVEDQVVMNLSRRFRALLRSDDLLARWSDHLFAICLHPARRVDLESAIQTAGRLAKALEEPILIDGTKVYVSASIGFCLLSRARTKTAQSWIADAYVAVAEARKQGGGAIRSYSINMQEARTARSDLRKDVETALAHGEIVPWFQPQLSTETGRITGFEALARWQHPQKGVLLPGAFLETIEEVGLTDKLCKSILSQSLEAVRSWDNAGLSVPTVGVNFCASELLQPDLAKHIQWELDRFDVAPERLSIEILETVMADSPDDLIVRNINDLRTLGCKLDLDDFGTGHASLAAIRRFGVNRIKIDRSFVMKADRDPDQQQMIGAILTMAERLEVETLAEGVESAGEHALLSQLGCDYVQGFGISRPMSLAQTATWITMHNQKLVEVPSFAGRPSQ